MTDLYLDNDVSLDLEPLLRQVGHQVTSTRALGQFRAGDDAQLLTAARNRWVLVTYNRRDFVMLHDAWLTWPAALGTSFPKHLGILALDPGLPRALAETVIALLSRTHVNDGALENELLWWHHRNGWRRRIVGVGWNPFLGI